jgi:glycolate oxidase FAD binding subunit
MPSSRSKRATGGVTIDGVLAADRISPATAQEAAEILADASARGEAVAPVGGATALSMGNPPVRVDLALSTERLSGIIDYEPTDLVLSVGAGSRLGDVQAVLGEHGQRLPIDPPGGADATIGGLIATARWGPLRYSAGTMRDLLIGISVAHPSGTVSKAGGMVVKNVSGYDMPRLYLGSLGTLGVITSANFKVLPKPRAEATILATYRAAEDAFADAALLRASREPLATLEVHQIQNAWAIAARIEGREQTVATVASRIAESLHGDVSRLDAESSPAWWVNYVARQNVRPEGDTVLIRCGVRPRDMSTLAHGIAAAMDDIGIVVPYLAATPGVGVVVARLDFGTNGSPERLAETQAMLLALAETATILSAPPPWKRGIDVWGRLPDGFDVMKSLREEFDPSRTINPGRFAGFL